MTPALRRWARLLAAPIAAGMLLLIAAMPAAAHAVLIDTNPADGAVVDQAPETITVTFNEPIVLAQQGTDLLDSDGISVEATITASDNQVVYQPHTVLDDGTYIVAWRVVSADTHAVAGGMTFSVGEASTMSAAAPTNSVDRQVNIARLLAEALRYAGGLALVGLLWFQLFIAREALAESESLRYHLRQARKGLAAVSVVAAIAVVPLTTLWQNGESLRALLRPGWWLTTWTGVPAAASGLLIGGVIVALLAARRGWVELAAIGMALAVGSFIIDGHTRTAGPPWLILPADLIHVTAASLWLGGLIGLLLALLPHHQLRVRTLAQIVGRFSAAALWLVVALTVAAIALWWRIADSITGLWTTYYGQLVLIKVALAVVIVLIAAWNRYRLVPQLTGHRTPSRPATSSAAYTRKTTSTLRRTMGAEALILAAVIGVTTVLVSQQPPEPAVDVIQIPGETLQATGKDVNATITLQPAAVGTNAIQIVFTDPQGTAMDLYDTSDIAIRLLDGDVGPFNSPLTRVGEQQYQAVVDFPLPGRWEISVPARISEFTAPVLTTEVDIS